MLTSLSDLIPSSLSAYVHITVVPPSIRCSVLLCILSPLIFPSYFLTLFLSPPPPFPLPLFLPEHAPVLSISPTRARAPFFPRHFTPSFSLHSLTVFSLPSFVVPHCPRSPPCFSLLALAAHSERFPPLSPSPLPCPFRSFAHLLHNRARGCQPAPRNTL